ncbi:transcriptional regulator [Streptomyces sp. NBC_01754]|uniref:transcriptional regulator n=1 Tax=Streptomyces sp. NBC_01754 TaxID=2975930 RepID=UPI002DDB1802|nr:transcriptional regulator [Streptomyces sp. NBC_01754]WSC90957.1 transcriptional regulator [Streptomyces sp. NBC_01754]WSC96549.1 transcriptional regulator [Streptomyces sp. NBC_01754]
MAKRSTDRVRIGDLVPADSPRLNGVDPAHVRRLSAVYPSLPPVLVHRSTLRVVDGMHRIGAAELLDLDTVEVQYFDGSEDQVFLRSVTANIAHGLPLSVTERKTAAGRILASRPSLSDRAVAACTGLDAKTVASVRARSAAGHPPLNTRTGTDGRAHPLDRTAERIHAAELMRRDPELSLRAVVKETGLSLGTAHDVRRRLLRGEDPVPPSRQNGPAPGTGRATPARLPEMPGSAAAAGPDRPRAAVPVRKGGPVSPRPRGPLDTLRRLAEDPSLRHSDTGRDLIRWLHIHFVVDEAWQKRADAVPPHATESMAELARHCSEAWRRFAEDMSRRKHADSPRRTDVHATQPGRR